MNGMHSEKNSNQRHKVIPDTKTFKGIIDSFDKCISVVIDLDGNILFANEKFCEIFSIKYDAIIRKNYFSFLKDTDIEKFKKKLKKLINSKVYNGENVILKIDKSHSVTFKQNVELMKLKGENLYRITLKNEKELHELENELNKTKRFLEGIIDNLPVTVFVKDAKEGKFVLWNRKCEQIFGLESEITLGKTDFDFFPKKQAEFFRKKDNEVLKSGKVIDIPEELIDGKLGRKYLHTIKVPIYDENDSPIFLLGFSEDITEKKEVEEAVKRSVALYTSLFKRLPIGLYRTRKDGTILEANPALVEMLGYPSREKLLEQNTFTVYPDEGLRRETLSKIKKKGQVYDFVIPLKKIDGSIIWVRDKTQIIEDENNIEYYEGFLEDITDRKLAEEALIDSEEKFRCMFEQSLDGLVLIDDKGKIIDCNKATENILGFKIAKILGKTVYDLFYSLAPKDNRNPDLYENLKNSFLSYIETGIYPWEKKWVERNIELSDGSMKVITSLIFPIQTGNRTIFCKILDDITERKKAEEEINELNRSLENKVMERTAMLRKSLQELNEEIELRKEAEQKLTDAKDNITDAWNKERELSELKSRFISMISHEYRTPLTIIMTSTFLLEKYYNIRDGEKFGEKIEMIQSSVQNMTQMLENVLLVGKSDKGSMRTKLKYCNIERLCEQVIEEVQIIDKFAHNIELVIEGDFKHEKTDEIMIHSILINLLLNSINYSPGNEDIRLELGECDDGMEFKIIDDGIGIPPSEKPYIFDSFFRGTNIGTSTGFGVGLTIVKTCVEELKGKINIESELYKGTKVTVYVPHQVDYV
ncbi:MAG: PAS domain-containing sensor histidine kinase [Bacteroidetes bacterium]|nr:MAG: PAS domain-containing sensor histidine kinase [Bacteroidota bacterium]